MGRAGRVLIALVLGGACRSACGQDGGAARVDEAVAPQRLDLLGVGSSPASADDGAWVRALRIFRTGRFASVPLGAGVWLRLGMDRMGTGSFRESEEIGLYDDPGLQVDAPDEAVQVVDATVDWSAGRVGPVSLLLGGGVRAIGVAGEGGASAIGSDDSEVTPMPVVGGSVRYEVVEGLSLLGRASTHVVDTGATYLDVSAEASVGLSAATDLVAGWRFLDARVRRGRGAQMERAAFYTAVRLLY